MRFFLVVFFEFFCLTKTVNASPSGILQVPTDYPTIQAAITAATSNDTILVAPGVYREAISTAGKKITLMGDGTNHAAIIQAPTNLAALTCINNETTNTVIRGFTIIGAAIGVNILTASPTVVDNIITNCAIGLEVANSSATILSNRITGASTVGINLSRGFFPIIKNNRIELNATGIGLSGGEPVIENNVIALNTDRGINIAGDSDPIIRQNVIYGNGGVSVYWQTPAGRRGVVLVHNTIVGAKIGGIAAVRGSGVQPGTVIVNNILVGLPALDLTVFQTPTYPSVAFNLFYAQTGPAILGDNPGLINQNENLLGPPIFLDVEMGELELVSGSPGIDLGASGYSPIEDFLGVVRPVDGNSDGTAKYDAGAYEFVPGPPRAPRSITSLGGPDSVDLTWRPFDLATSYLLLRSLSVNGPFTPILLTTETAFTDVQVQRNVDYFYRIAGSNSFGLGAPSAPIQVRAGNFPPIANPDFASVLEDTPREIFPLLNDTDGNNDPLRIVRLESPIPTGAVLTLSNTIFYSPPTNLAKTNILLTYVVEDGRTGLSTNKVTLTILPVNDPPMVGNQSFIVNGNTNSIVSLAIVDPDSVEFDVIVDQPPIHGTILPGERGRFEYRPVWGYSGSDSATIRISDREAMSAPFLVSLSVKQLADIDVDGLADAWENFWDLNNPLADLDQDGMNNLQEYLANTSPRSAQSLLKIIGIERTPENSIAVSWLAVGGARYRIYSTDSFNSPFSPVPLSAQSEIDPAFYDTMHERTFVDTRPVSSTGTRFYRVEVVQ